MKTTLTLLVGLLLAAPLSAAAEIPERYTNDNYWTSEHDAPDPDRLTVLPGGQFYGYTETGKFFYQVTVVTSARVRLQKFVIDDAYFYLSPRGVIRAENAREALVEHVRRERAGETFWSPRA